MYSIVVDDNNYMHTSVYKPILQKSNLTDSIKILVPEIYSKYDMKEFSAELKYKTPQSGKVGAVIMSDPTILENGYIQFVVPVDINMTTEAGILKIILTFTKMDKLKEGTALVRKVGPADVPITAIGEWDGEIPDEDIDAMDKKLAEMQNMIDDVKDMQEKLDKEKADNLRFENQILQLMSHNDPIGDQIKIENSDLEWKEI